MRARLPRKASWNQPITLEQVMTAHQMGLVLVGHEQVISGLLSGVGDLLPMVRWEGATEGSPVRTASTNSGAG